MLLEACGVPDEVIVEDYALSEARLQPLIAEWLPRLEQRGVPPARAARLMESREADMRETLVHIRSTWGSGESYLAEQGLSPSAIGSLRAWMVA